MKYKFDDWGWYAGTANDDIRTTAVSPGTVPEKVVGQPYPNWNNSEWIMAPYIEPVAPPEPEPEPEDPRMWQIDVGPFYDRFGMDAAAIAASTHPACAAVRILTGVRKFIDLRDPSVSTMMDLLIATNQPAATPLFPGSGPLTAEKKATILTTPTTDYERHVKGL